MKVGLNSSVEMFFLKETTLSFLSSKQKKIALVVAGICLIIFAFYSLRSKVFDGKKWNFFNFNQKPCSKEIVEKSKELTTPQVKSKEIIEELTTPQVKSKQMIKETSVKGVKKKTLSIENLNSLNGYYKLKRENGDKYKGMFKGGKLNGPGMIIFKNRILDGTFEDNKLIKGTIIYAPNSIIKTKEGTFNQKEEVDGAGGKIIYSNGDIEEGTFKDDELKEGAVTYLNPDSGVALNETIKFKKGKFNQDDDDTITGQGKIIYFNGDEEEGTFDNDILIQGTITYHTFKEEDDPKQKKGTFNKETGDLIQGIITYYDGEVHDGTFDEDEVLSKGTITEANGEVTTVS